MSRGPFLLKVYNIPGLDITWYTLKVYNIPGPGITWYILKVYMIEINESS